MSQECSSSSRRLKGCQECSSSSRLCCVASLFVGLDCFGPFLVKRGRSQEKRYGLLFTCLTIRAIHIETLNHMDSDSFINALIRFVARRGCPSEIWSDNGSNFVGGEREIREEVEKWNMNPKVNEFLLLKRIKRTYYRRHVT